MITNERGLSEEQIMMRDACRAFVNDFVTPFVRKNWQREWDMNPDNRLPPEIMDLEDLGIVAQHPATTPQRTLVPAYRQ